jgi:hypothetical protein
VVVLVVVTYTTTTTIGIIIATTLITIFLPYYYYCCWWWLWWWCGLSIKIAFNHESKALLLFDSLLGLLISHSVQHRIHGHRVIPELSVEIAVFITDQRDVVWHFHIPDTSLPPHTASGDDVFDRSGICMAKPIKITVFIGSE